MAKRLAIIGMTLLLIGFVASSAQSQNSIIVPGAPGPVPLPPPLPPPMVVLPPPGQPSTGITSRPDSFSDRVARCAHFGGINGLPPGSLDAYTRACANN